ncbi:ribokinase [bacterium BMS3Bbin03]|nr:ribokinase [bacterium BMS3Bbin03]
MPKITVIGTIVRDTIYPYKGEPVYGWGGIYYTLSYLSGILKEKAVLEPVFYVGYDVWDAVQELLSQKFPNVRKEGIRKINQKNNRVTLKYLTPEHREEISNFIPPPLPFEAIRPFVKNDIILLNFISGYEITFETCQRLVTEKTGFLYMDFHSLAYGRNEDGSRFYRRPENWREWVRMPDFLQMNEKEAETLAARPLTALEDYTGFAEELVQIGKNILNMTLGPKGSILAFLEKGTPVVHYLKALNVRRVVDVTGCGDSFAAGFIAKYIETKDPVEAAKFGNVAGGLNCTFQSTSKADTIYLRVDEALNDYNEAKPF